MKLPLRLLLVSLLLAQGGHAEEPAGPNLSFCLESFSLPLAEAAALIRQGLEDPRLYQSCVANLGTGKARQESLTVLRAKSGQPVTSEALLQTIYPTEYEPSERPNSVGSGPPPDQPSTLIATQACPTSFETRGLGLSIQCRSTFDSANHRLTFILNSEWTRLVGRSSHGQGNVTIEMPEIETQRHDAGTDLTPGKPHLLGTFNRTPESTDDPSAATRVWFSFVTTSLIEP